MIKKICEENPRPLEEYEKENAIVLIGLHTITTVLAIFLNALVMWTVHKTPSLHSPSRILLCSLAMTDFLIGALVQPSIINYFIAILKNWHGQFCITWVLNTRFGYCLGSISVLTLAMISVDRCLAITMKTAYRTVVTKNRAAVLVVCVWVCTSGLVLSTLHLLRPQHFDIVLAAIMAISLITSIVSYSIAFHSLKRLSVQVSTNQLSMNGQPASDFNEFKYRRSLITMLIILTATLLLYFPLLFFTSKNNFFPSHIHSQVLAYCEFLVVLSSTVNPLIYLWRMIDLRQAAKTVLKLN